MTVQINLDLRRTLTVHATKGLPPALCGLTRQLNYMCKYMRMRACFTASITRTTVNNHMSWILFMNTSKCTSNAYVCVCFVGVCVFVHTCGGNCVLCKRGAQWGGLDQLCAGPCRLWGVAGRGGEDMSALCVGTPRSSLLIHCSPAPTNR